MSRRRLRDRAASPYYIETLPKRGYRFIASIASVSHSARGHAGLVVQDGTIVVEAPRVG